MYINRLYQTVFSSRNRNTLDPTNLELEAFLRGLFLRGHYPTIICPTYPAGKSSRTGATHSVTFHLPSPEDREGQAISSFPRAILFVRTVHFGLDRAYLSLNRMLECEIVFKILHNVDIFINY